MCASSGDSRWPVHVEMMEFNGSMNGGIYFGFCFIRFPHLSHMLSHYAQLSSSKQLRLFGSIQKLKMDGFIGTPFTIT